jgi:hypothetical protein
MGMQTSGKLSHVSAIEPLEVQNTLSVFIGLPGPMKLSLRHIVYSHLHTKRVKLSE